MVEGDDRLPELSSDVCMYSRMGTLCMAGLLGVARYKWSWVAEGALDLEESQDHSTTQTVFKNLPQIEKEKEKDGFLR